MTTIEQTLTPEARAILNGAHQTQHQADRITPIDYAAANRVFKRQKGQLTRAINSGDASKIVVTVRDHVREWDTNGFPWPDSWSTWQRALNDALPWNQPVDLNDLRI